MRGGFTLDRLEKLDFSLLISLIISESLKPGIVVELCKHYLNLSDSREDADERRSFIQKSLSGRRAAICWSLLIHLWESDSSRASVLKSMFTVVTMENLYLLPAQLIRSLWFFCRTAASLKASKCPENIELMKRPKTSRICPCFIFFFTSQTAFCHEGKSLWRPAIDLKMECLHSLSNQ